MPLLNSSGPAGKNRRRLGSPNSDRCGNNAGMGRGVGGNCICPNCGTTVPHQRQIPCTLVKCPTCGSAMIRQS